MAIRNDEVERMVARTAERLRGSFSKELARAGEGTVEPRAGYSRARDEIVFLVGRCLEQGVTIRRLAVESGVAGHLLLAFVEDPQRRAEAYGAELHHLERTLATVRAERQRLAVAEVRTGEELQPGGERHAAGLEKRQIATRWGVTRPTLDKWIDAAGDAAAARTGEPGC